MKGGHFHIQLISPGTAELQTRYAEEIREIADNFSYWKATSSEDRSRVQGRGTC